MCTVASNSALEVILSFFIAGDNLVYFLKLFTTVTFRKG